MARKPLRDECTAVCDILARFGLQLCPFDTLQGVLTSDVLPSLGAGSLKVVLVRFVVAQMQPDHHSSARLQASYPDDAGASREDRLLYRLVTRYREA